MGVLSQFDKLDSWAKWTFIFVAINIVLHVLIVSCAIIGGYFDLKRMLKDLASSEIDETDDGRVVDG